MNKELAPIWKSSVIRPGPIVGGDIKNHIETANCPTGDTPSGTCTMCKEYRDEVTKPI